MLTKLPACGIMKGSDMKDRIDKLVEASILYEGIEDLQQIEGVIQEVKGFYIGSDVGGGQFYYDPDMDKAEHNGGTVIAPEAIAAWDGTSGDIATLLDWSGVGAGCFVRIFSGFPHVDYFGAVGDYDASSDTGNDDSESFKKWLLSSTRLSHDGDRAYKVTQELSPQENSLILGFGSEVYQRDITKPLFNLNAASGSEFHGGDYSHNMDIADYNINNGRLFYSNIFVSDITLYQVKIFKTAQQGFDIDNGGERIKVVLCHFEETARDGVFLVDVTDANVSLNTFLNTGDDSIAFAKNSYRHTCTSNNIIGAGSYNLGGSGIRSNSTGSITSNTILNSDLFGVIAASNSTDVNINPDGLVIANNEIQGINKTNTVTAGIGFKEVTNVSCINNNIDMVDQLTNAYRIYGTGKKSESISIIGGVVKNARSLCFVRDLGVENFKVKDAHYKDCLFPILIEGSASGAVDSIEIHGNTSENVSSASYLAISTSNLSSVGKITTSDNRVLSAQDVAFRYGNKSFTLHTSSNDQFSTGVYADYAETDSAGDIFINGRFGDITNDVGTVTFNATNSGLIALDLSSNIIPLASEVSVVQRSSLGAANNWYVDFIDGLNFRITLDSAPAADVTFDWSVSAFDNRKM